MTMSIDWYRRIFVTDMANRTLNTPYNTLPPEEWLRGWSQMLEPGAYERGIFGDLMLPGIACGVKKVLLIFNTNPDSPHDPIYVVSPSDFDVQPDTEIPIVLCYNMSHYESLKPCAEHDIQATVNLVKEYKQGRYSYSRKDIPNLISHTVDLKIQEPQPHFAEDIETKKKTYMNKESRKSKQRNEAEITNDEINLEEIDEFLDLCNPHNSEKDQTSGNNFKESKQMLLIYCLTKFLGGCPYSLAGI